MIKRSESNSRCRQEYFRVPEYEEQNVERANFVQCQRGNSFGISEDPTTTAEIHKYLQRLARAVCSERTLGTFSKFL